MTFMVRMDRSHPNIIKDDYEDYWEDQPRPPISPTEHGFYAPAYRRDLYDSYMRDLRAKGYSYRKIAEICKCSPNTVRNHLLKEALI